MSERVKVLEAELQARPTMEMLASQSEKLTSLQDVSKMHESRLSALEVNQRSGGGAGGGGGMGASGRRACACGTLLVVSVCLQVIGARIMLIMHCG